jgi:hypothetical protein
MGYSLEICHKCNNIDTTANLKRDNDERYCHECCNLKKLKKCDKMKIDDKYKRLSKLFPNKRYISAKTLMCPDSETAKEYLKRFFLKRNYKKPNNMTIWNEFWKGLDYLVLNENKQNTKKYKETFNFINDLQY